MAKDISRLGFATRAIHAGQDPDPATGAALEGGERGLAFASGLAATTAVLSLLRPGDEVAASADLYGGTFRLFERVFKPWGLVARYTEDPSPTGFSKIINTKTRLVWVETPTNPLLQIV